MMINDMPLSAALKTIAPPWYKHIAFQVFVACVVCFLLCYVVLLAIRPPFTYVRPSEDAVPDTDTPGVPGALHHRRPAEFRGGRAALGALVVTGVVLIAIVLVYVIVPRKRRRVK